MAQFTPDLLSVCKSYGLDPKDIVFAFAVASGCNPTDAYIITHNLKQAVTTLQAETQANDLLQRKSGLKIVINRIKNQKNIATFKKQQQRELEDAIRESKEITDEEKDELKTRQGLIGKIIDNVLLTTGKDAISGLQTLAKLQGLDSPDEKPEEERRKYFLPWVSNCRSCKLMQIYIKTINENTTKQGETI